MAGVSATGATRAGLGAWGPLSTGGLRAASFFSGVCAGAGSCSGSEVAGAETSLLLGFSGRSGVGASSVVLLEAVGRLGAAAELRRSPKVKLGKEAGRAEAVVTGRGAAADPVLLACWFPNAKPVLIPLGVSPPKPTMPEGPVLAGVRLPKTPAEELLVLVAVAGAIGTAGTEVTEGSVGLSTTGGPVKLNPEGPEAGCALDRLGGGVLLADLVVVSSVWPTRSPEKLPRVSPLRGPGNSSASLTGGVSSLLGVEEKGIITGLLGNGAASLGEATVALAVSGRSPEGPEEAGLSGAVS